MERPCLWKNVEKQIDFPHPFLFYFFQHYQSFPTVIHKFSPYRFYF